ncbi:MAG: hypothetical protein ACQERN_13750 [Thermodesulfobacteriota bacterium]
MGTPKIAWLLVLVFVQAGISVPAARGQGLSEADLNGRYFVSEIRAGKTLFYSLQFDGQGTITDVNLQRSSFTVSPNDDENLDTREQEAVGIFPEDAYAVAPEGAITIAGRSLAGSLHHAGAQFVLVQTATGGEPRWGLGIRAGQNLTDTSLIGGYYIHVLELSVVDAGDDGRRFESNAGVVDASINGQGNISGQLIAGDESGLGPLFSVTYTVDANGRLTVGREGETSGMLADDPRVFTVVDTNPGDNDLLVMIGVPKAAATITDSDFLDSYFFSAFEIQGETVDSASQYSDTFGEITFDENGDFLFTETATTRAGPLETIAGSAETDTDGRFEMQGATGTLLTEGSLFVATGVEPDSPALRVGLAKTADRTPGGTDDGTRDETEEEPISHDDFCFVSFLYSACATGNRNMAPTP